MLRTIARKSGARLSLWLMLALLPGYANAGDDPSLYPALHFSLEFGVQESAWSLGYGFQARSDITGPSSMPLALLAARGKVGGSGAYYLAGWRLSESNSGMAEDRQGMSTATKWMIGLGLTALALYHLVDETGDAIDREARNPSGPVFNPGDGGDDPDDGAVTCIPLLCL